ncbi:50S ribosomal protein L9 [Candidatus Peregrinibacteria bacterium]|nr:50S ribosomal protein L9 [Candidatus Peregrinibacteria bacterium]
MEILLLQDIKGIGKKNDLLVVGDGFALNNLLPRRIALVATPLVRRRYAELIRKRAEERETERQIQVGAVQAINGKVVTFAKKVTKTGKLYGAINEDMIAAALKDQHSIDIAASAIDLPEHIKAVGTFSAKVAMGQQQAVIQVKVEAEKAK